MEALLLAPGLRSAHYLFTLLFTPSKRLFVHIYIALCVGLCMCAEAHGGHRRELTPLKLELCAPVGT